VADAVTDVVAAHDLIRVSVFFWWLSRGSVEPRGSPPFRTRYVIVARAPHFLAEPAHRVLNFATPHAFR
jgi:hypothetical protein